MREAPIEFRSFPFLCFIESGSNRLLQILLSMPLNLKRGEEERVLWFSKRQLISFERSLKSIDTKNLHFFFAVDWSRAQIIFQTNEVDRKNVEQQTIQ